MRRTLRKRYRNRKTRKAKKVQKGGQQLLSVSFPSFQAAEELPTKLLPETQAAPTISWPSSPPLKTILCWDPDAPAKSWVHLLSINCSGTDPSSGTEVFSWAPPSPPAGTGRHRYLFTLYEQKGPIELSLSERGNVAVEEIVQAKQLKKVAEVGFKAAA